MKTSEDVLLGFVWWTDNDDIVHVVSHVEGVPVYAPWCAETGQLPLHLPKHTRRTIHRHPIPVTCLVCVTKGAREDL